MSTRLSKKAALIAMVVGIAGGSYGLASAATGNSSSTTSTPAATAAPTAPPGANGGAPWGHQRSDETLLTGDALSKVTAIAKSKVPGGTIVRVETDADGVATYEAHMTKADGTPVTVYVDSNFQFVSVQ
jgi:peptidase YpeB-like protein